MCDSAADGRITAVLVGIAGVGKSTLLRSFMTGKYVPEAEPTIGVATSGRGMLTGGKRIAVAFWDTAGQERYGSLLPMYTRNANILIGVVPHDGDGVPDDAVSGLNTSLRRAFEAHAGDLDHVALVATKADLGGNALPALMLLERTTRERLSKTGHVATTVSTATTTAQTPDQVRALVNALVAQCRDRAVARSATHGRASATLVPIPDSHGPRRCGC